VANKELDGTDAVLYLLGPAGAFAQEYTVMRNTLSDNKLYGHEKRANSAYLI
jgi:hypothetical protein